MHTHTQEINGYTVGLLSREVANIAGYSFLLLGRETKTSRFVIATPDEMVITTTFHFGRGYQIDNSDLWVQATTDWMERTGKVILTFNKQGPKQNK